MTIAQLHLTGFTSDDVETLGRFAGVPEETLARMVEASKLVESLPQRSSSFGELDEAFTLLESVLERIPSHWHFDRLEHQHDSSGAWRARAVLTGVHPREIVATYARRPAAAVTDLAQRLGSRYSVAGIAPTTVGGTTDD